MKDREKILKRKSVVFALMFCACFLWGSAFACVKIGYDMFDINKSSIPSLMLFAGIRYILAGLLLLIPGLILKKDDFKLNPKRVKSIGINSIFQVIGQYTFYYIGIASTPGVRTAIINSTTVFISIFLAAVVFKKEKYTFAKAISSLMAVLSVVILNLQKGFEFKFRPFSEGFILLASFCAAMAIVLQNKLTENITPASLCSYSFLLGGIVFTSYALLFGARVSFNNWRAVLLLLYLAFISSAAFTIQGTLLKYNDVSEISIYRIMNPIIGVIMSALLLKGEKNSLLSINTLLALLIIVAAIAILRLSQKKNKKEVE